MRFRNRQFVLPRLRQPEYTGANRCVPCTVVNVVIAAAVAAVVAPWSVPVAVGAFAASLGLVYLRGYLVPGTPALTRRYLPAWVLAYFGKEPGFGHGDATVDPGSVLLETGLLVPTPDGEDLRLDPAFAADWGARTGALLAAGPDHDRDLLAAVLDVSAADLLVAAGEDGLDAYHDGTFVAAWESRTAFTADMAGIELLAPLVPGWAGLSPGQRGELASTLRLFTESCPGCGGPVDLDERTGSTCCSTYEVVTADCPSCGSSLLELPVSGAMRAAMGREK